MINDFDIVLFHPRDSHCGSSIAHVAARARSTASGSLFRLTLAESDVPLPPESEQKVIHLCLLFLFFFLFEKGGGGLVLNVLGETPFGLDGPCSPGGSADHPRFSKDSPFEHPPSLCTQLVLETYVTCGHKPVTI